MIQAETRAPLLPGLQYYRAGAALLVVLYHAAGVFGPGGYYPLASWERAFAFGHCGVELFFVLSGFIICQVHWDRIGRAGELTSYVRKRLVRIYPPVILVVLVWAAFRLAIHKPLSSAEWVNSLTLFPTTFEFAPPLLWTLSFEMAFYALFLIAFVNRRLFLIGLAAWGISGYVLCEFTDFAHQNNLNPLLGSAYVFLFGFGAIAFFINRRIARMSNKWALALATAGLVVFAATAWFDAQLHTAGLQGVAFEVAERKLTPLFGAAGVLWIVAIANTGFSLRGPAHHILFFLGNASYAIYLWHLLGQRLLTQALGRAHLDGLAMRPVAMLLLIGGGVVLGSLVYAFVEKPMLRGINAVLTRKPRH